MPTSIAMKRKRKQPKVAPAKTAKTTKRPVPAKRTVAGKPSPDRVLVLRTCDASLKSYNGFQWPASGVCVAPDWNAKPTCGHGLHGLLWGEGNGSLLDWSSTAKWLIVAVDPATIVDIGGKVKFPRGEVLLVGDRIAATEYLLTHGGEGKKITGACVKAGYSGTATAGYRGTATAGDRGTATAGDSGTATAGDSGTATAGDRGTATAGDSGTATAGEGGAATAGEGGAISIRWWDQVSKRYRVAISEVSEVGEVKPAKKYRVGEGGKLVEVPAGK